MRQALSLTSASNELMRRCLLRRQHERLFPTFYVSGHLCHGFSLNERFLRVLTTIYLQRRYHSSVRNFSDVPGKPIALDLVGEGDIYTRHEGHVRFGFGAATGAACGFGHARDAFL